jgi:hypothetical protein
MDQSFHTKYKIAYNLRSVRYHLHDFSSLLYSALFDRPDRSLWQDVRTFCLFIGYSRSGHTLVSELINAHPQVVISQEVNALLLIQLFNIKQDFLFHTIQRNAAAFDAKGHVWGSYKFEVPNLHKSRSRLSVMGDKHGPSTTFWLSRNPQLLAKARRNIGLPIKFLHVVRNPYDNITTISIKQALSLDRAIDFHFSRVRANFKLEELLRDDLLLVRYEQFVHDPAAGLRRICGFLDLPVTDHYLDNCASIVFTSPQLSRHKVVWSTPQIERVRMLCQDVYFLRDYAYDE